MGTMSKALLIPKPIEPKVLSKTRLIMNINAALRPAKIEISKKSANKRRCNPVRFFETVLGEDMRPRFSKCRERGHRPHKRSRGDLYLST